MKEIIKLILKYHFTIIFVLLEVISISLVIINNNYQRSVFSSYAASVSGFISSGVSSIESYINLRQTNEGLVAENTILKNEVEQLKAYRDIYFQDTIHVNRKFPLPDYIYQKARMVNISFNKTKNSITIDKGRDEGIEKEMGVTSPSGVIGIVMSTGDNYSIVLPLLNTNLRVSAKLQKNGYYGSLQWDGNDYRYSYLNDIPFHVDMKQGDTIITSGFAAIFPEGELIGFVESVDRQTANFLSIKVKLATDFKKVSDVYIIHNTRRREQLELEGIINE